MDIRWTSCWRATALAGGHCTSSRISLAASDWPYLHGLSCQRSPQYRMLPPIGRLVSDTFYREINLEHGRKDPEVDPTALPSELAAAITWIATDGLGEQ